MTKDNSNEKNGIEKRYQKSKKELFEEILNRSESGEILDPEEYLRRHPEFAEDLENLFKDLKLNRTELGDECGEDDNEQVRITTDQVFGDFKIISELGRGGMGTVYEAEQMSLHRKVALKILPPHLSLSDLAVRKFQREAEAGGRQSHPGIVAIHAVGKENNVHYIAQELVGEGITLADRLDDLRKQDDFPPGYFREVARLVSEIADAMQHAHDSGVIHRDIKPSNILLAEEGQPKITDFGLARVEDALSLSRTGDFSGTPYYMSPEQAASRRIGIDHRTDIFSLGVTLYELLTLVKPFEGKTSHEVLKKILLIEPRDPRKSHPKTPHDLSVISLKAMEKNPDRRYQSMEDYGDDLRCYMNGDVIQAKPASLTIKLCKRMKRYPVVSTAVIVSMIAFLFFITTVPWIVAVKENEKKAELQSAYDEIIRLSDVKILKDLILEEKDLWPAYPVMIPQYERWNQKAVQLIDRLPSHKDKLIALRERARPYDKETKEYDIVTSPVNEELTILEEDRNRLQNKIKELKEKQEVEDSSEQSENQLADHIKTYQEQIAVINSRIDSLKYNITKRHKWLFDSYEEKWQHDTIQQLTNDLETFMEGEDGIIRDIEKRLNFAKNVHNNTIEKYKDEWQRAIDHISNNEECQEYDGLKITAQLGFVPLGPDPRSGLWEFGHLQSGDIPVRSFKEGDIEIGLESGMVFVLIPGGSFKMGAQKPSDEFPEGSPNVDPQAVDEEGPVRTITIKPFFLSKYEMTQAQWLRVTGNEPSQFGLDTVDVGEIKHTRLHPVENVSWYDCVDLLGKLNLRLPSEAEWEYAARAGTNTVWWTGNNKESLIGTANIRDVDYHELSENQNPYEKWLKDGYFCHAPIGKYKPNLYGLYDINGNVWEWCQDAKASYDEMPTDGSAYNSIIEDERVFRGGSWNSLAEYCRSSFRSFLTSEKRSWSILGVRPAYSLVE